MQTSQQNKLANYPQPLRRIRQTTHDKNECYIHDKHGRAYINFSGFDYLGLSPLRDEHLDAISHQSCRAVGSTASPVVSGYSPLHEQLEDEFCHFVGCERGVVFSSGYLANIGVLQALCGRHDILLADKRCHASLIDGAVVSRVDMKRYRHLDMSHLQYLNDINACKPGIIASEGVFSVDGEIAPIRHLQEISKMSGRLLLIDDAHGFGVLGDGGRGVFEDAHTVLTNRCVLVVPMGKAMGCMGALVGGSSDVIDSIVQFSRTYRYDTALSPLLVACALSNLRRLQQDKWRRNKLSEIIHIFKSCAKRLDLPFIHSDTPIHSLSVACPKRCAYLYEQIKENGYQISYWRPPTVPDGHSRLRISLNIFHSPQQVTQFVELLAGLWHAKTSVSACPL